MRGQCLCGGVVFEVTARRLKLYRCHCSLCRRQSGTASNCAAIVSADKLRWVGGTEMISSWRKPTGYRSDFCSRCGSPVPNRLASRDAFWVPAGLLEGDARLDVVADFHLASRAAWDVDAAAGARFDGLTGDEFFALVHDA